MKKHLVFRLLSLSSVLAITACGYGLKEVYDGIPYNSTNFVENYFTTWDKAIDYRKGGNSITETKTERVLSKHNDLVFEYLEDVKHEDDYKNFQKCEPNWLNYAYVWDRYEPTVLSKKGYGPDVSLNKADNSFKKGVRSKLFDGQMFCNGDFQQARIQVGSTNSTFGGFGIQLEKECFSSSYFMCNFKCSTVTDKNQNLRNSLKTNLKLKIGFYLKNDSGFTYIPTSYVIENAPTNSGDDHSDFPPEESRYRGRIGNYVCFGFKLHDDEDKENKYLDLTRLSGISFEYELIDVIDTDTNTSYVPPVGETMYHSIMLYEVSLPHSTWH